MQEKLGRNDPCHCGSGKKYKSCCMQKDQDKERAGTTPLGKRKFTAKVLSGPAAAEPQEQQKPPVDYTTLMERSFGNAIHENDKPPVPKSPDQYVVKPVEEE